MNLPIDTLPHFAAVALLAFGLAYVVTGSVIGAAVRFVWWHVTRGGLLSHLAYCPACCAWWCGLAVSLATAPSLSWVSFVIALQGAFVACGVAAAAQSQFGLAANDAPDKGVAGEATKE